eukprot:g19642.t1
MVPFALPALGALLTSIPEVAADPDDDGRCLSGGRGCIKFQVPKHEATSMKERTTLVTRRLASFNGATAEALVAALIGDSESVVPSNTYLECPQDSSGLVSYGVEGHAFEALMIGTEENVVLSSGNANVVSDLDNTVDSTTTTTGGGRDTDIEAVINLVTYDACSLEFDFELSPGSVGGTLQFQYIFMSEEYNEFVNDSYNDGFLLLIDGVNVAKIPGTQDVVSINTINNGANSGLYNDNEDNTFQLRTAIRNPSPNTSAITSSNANTNYIAHASSNTSTNASTNYVAHASSNTSTNASTNYIAHASSNTSSVTSSITSPNASTTYIADASSNTSTSTSSNANSNASTNANTNYIAHASSNTSTNASTNYIAHASSNTSSITSSNASTNASTNYIAHASSDTSTITRSNASTITSTNASTSYIAHASSDADTITSCNFIAHASSNTISSHAISNANTTTSTNYIAHASTNTSTITISNTSTNASTTCIAHTSSNTSTNTSSNTSTSYIAHTSFNSGPKPEPKPGLTMVGETNMNDGVMGEGTFNGPTALTVSPGGRCLFVVAAGNSSLTSLIVGDVGGDGGSGNLTYAGTVSDTALASAWDIDISPHFGDHVYVSSQACGCVMTFAVDLETCGLTYLSNVTESLVAPAGISVSPNGLFLYVADSGVSGGSLVVFSINMDSGELVLLQRILDGDGPFTMLGGAVSVAVSPSGMDVYVASSSPGALAHFCMNGNSGELESVAWEENETPTDLNLDGASSVAVNPANSRVFVASTANDTLWVLNVIRDAGSDGCSVLELQDKIREGDEDRIRGLAGARSIAVSPAGDTVLVVSSTTGTIAVFRYNTAGGPTPAPTTSDGGNASPPSDGEEWYKRHAVHLTLGVITTIVVGLGLILHLIASGCCCVGAAAFLRRKIGVDCPACKKKFKAKREGLEDRAICSCDILRAKAEKERRAKGKLLFHPDPKYVTACPHCKVVFCTSCDVRDRKEMFPFLFENNPGGGAEEQDA